MIRILICQPTLYMQHGESNFTENSENFHQYMKSWVQLNMYPKYPIWVHFRVQNRVQYEEVLVSQGITRVIGLNMVK